MLSHNHKIVDLIGDDSAIDDAELAAVAFLARYSGRTLDAYRFDLRTFFQWAADVGLPVLAASRPHIESPTDGLQIQSCICLI